MEKAAEQLGISVNALACCHACILAAKKKKKPDGKGFVFSEREKELQKQIDELKEENEILRAAMRFFVVDQK